MPRRIKRMPRQAQKPFHDVGKKVPRRQWLIFRWPIPGSGRRRASAASADGRPGVLPRSSRYGGDARGASGPDRAGGARRCTRGRSWRRSSLIRDCGRGSRGSRKRARLQSPRGARILRSGRRCGWRLPSYMPDDLSPSSFCASWAIILSRTLSSELSVVMKSAKFRPFAFQRRFPSGRPTSRMVISTRPNVL